MRFLSGQNAIVQGGTLIVLLMDQKSMNGIMARNIKCNHYNYIGFLI